MDARLCDHAPMTIRKPVGRGAATAIAFTHKPGSGCQAVSKVIISLIAKISDSVITVTDHGERSFKLTFNYLFRYVKATQFVRVE
jgi:hypothetical protein